MAPKSLLKTLKYKPQVQLNMDAPPPIEKATLGTWVKPKIEMPLPKPQELAVWAKARALQQENEAGQPVEGWPARIDAMKADGRLWYSPDDKLWHRRG
jgi:DNA-directed RNA polymerase subunit K/omega